MSRDFPPVNFTSIFVVVWWVKTWKILSAKPVVELLTRIWLTSNVGGFAHQINRTLISLVSLSKFWQKYQTKLHNESKLMGSSPRHWDFAGQIFGWNYVVGPLVNYWLSSQNVGVFACKWMRLLVMLQGKPWGSLDQKAEVFYSSATVKIFRFWLVPVLHDRIFVHYGQYCLSVNGIFEQISCSH